jgi:TatD DNase family protein
LFINVHCHNNQTPVNEWVIKNIFQDFGNFPESGFFSAGIHPCYIPSQNLEAQFMVLEKCLTNPKILAIGECGIDKLSPFPIEVQLPVFLKQIELASNCKKPLIIHCVKAYEDNAYAKHYCISFTGAFPWLQKKHSSGESTYP